MSDFIVPLPVERRRYSVASAPLRIIGAALCAYGMPVAAMAFTEQGMRMGLGLQVLTTIRFPDGFIEGEFSDPTRQSKMNRNRT